MDQDGRGSGEELERVKEGETVIRIYYMRKESIFNKTKRGGVDLPPSKDPINKNPS